MSEAQDLAGDLVGIGGILEAEDATPGLVFACLPRCQLAQPAPIAQLQFRIGPSEILKPTQFELGLQVEIEVLLHGVNFLRVGK